MKGVECCVYRVDDECIEYRVAKCSGGLDLWRNRIDVERRYIEGDDEAGRLSPSLVGGCWQGFDGATDG